MTTLFFRCGVILTGFIMVGFPLVVGGLFGEERNCDVPERFYTFEPPLAKTPRALAAGRHVVIAALGGASTLGLAAGKTELAWPARLASALDAEFRSGRTTVANLSVARQTARKAAERVDRDVLPLKPTLVIWETGTMEAVRGIHIDEFRKTLQDGIDDLRAAGAEVVLMDMQFSRDTDAMIEFEPYVVAMREVADANDVPLFRRYGIMRYWAEKETLDFRTRDPEKRRQLAATLYDCIGRAMAHFVTRGLPASKSMNTPGGSR